MIILCVVVSSTGGVGKSVQRGSEDGTFGKRSVKTGFIRETRTEMGNSGSKKPNLMVVFNKNSLKPWFLGLKKIARDRIRTKDLNIGIWKIVL